jgi:uncharacterized membrane protein (DUF485 family)
MPQDPTADVVAAAKIDPSGQRKLSAPYPSAEGSPGVDWGKLAASDQFGRLLKAKRRFIVPAMIFFIVYYFSLPVLIGYARPLMEKRVLGPVNLAYLFALSQFFMAWIIAALYVRAAARFDRMAADVVSQSTSIGE